MKKRIAIDARMLTYSGIGRYIKNLLIHISRIDKKNKYSALINSEDEALETNNHLEFRKTRSRIPVYSIKEQILLPFELKRLDSDLIHYPSFNVPIISSSPAVITLHDLIYFLEPKACPSKLSHYYARLLFNMAARIGKKIIADSEYTKNDIIKYLGVSPGKVKVIYMGIEENYFPRTDKNLFEMLRVKYGLRGDYVFYVGNHSPNKNLTRLIHAFSGTKNKNCDLIIGGKINIRRKPLYDLPKELGLGDRVRFIGKVAEDDLPALYSMAKLFVFPSIFEGFGFPPLEAMACGLPVLTSNATSLPEVVGEAAVKVDPFDTALMAHNIDRVLSNKDLREELREKGLLRAKQFSWERTARETLELYEDVLNC